MNLFAIAVLPILAWFTYLLTRKKYKVYENGIVLITGGSSGIGLETAKYLAQNRSFVVYASVRDENDFRIIQDVGLANLLPILMDVTDENSIENAIKTLRNHSDREQLPLIAVVHNAGINTNLPAELHPLNDMKQVFDTNFFAIVDLVQKTLPLLRESKGRIIMLSSIIASQPWPKASIYAASKAALEAFSDSLRREVDPFGISVSIIKPGFVHSEMNRKILENPSIVDERVLSTAQNLYSNLYDKRHTDKMIKLVQMSDHPITVSKTIAAAISDPYPRTRYYSASVSKVPTWLLSGMLWMTPDRIQDMFVRTLLKT